MWEPTLFLADRALRCRSRTGDTVRTYAEALLVWLKFLVERSIEMCDADEEAIGLFRAQLVHGGHTKPLAATTANHRVTVAGLFHQWGQRSGSMPSPLGKWLVATGRENSTADPRRYARSIKRLGIAPAVVRRLPRLLSREEVSRLFLVAPMPHRLMFRWSLATGMRRFEVCDLRLDQLPGAVEAARVDQGLLPIDLLRKGSRQCTVYAPVGLVEETNWYVLLERPESGACEVFVNRHGSPMSRHALTSMFRRCADEIGSKATLHHLRHTFAAHVLRVLEGYDRRGDAMNSLKTLQVMLGHASIETTEIYLRAVEVSGEPVVRALEFLYGETLA
ncbi:site-specific recombinase XerD [Kinneretia asaccharophila]|uniref:Site-specific recombinase XerD n=1 Tax=Roseateles asaccharophilus TaxID=582607 RepID=A0ABU2A6D8_9BURK|nr:site-specific recombinase XerD [Roseateles asaccharophilus]